MSYSSGMLRDRVEILRKVQAAGKIGKSSGAVAFESLGTVWAQVAFNRGMKAMREAALDGTDYVIVRMRYNTIANRNCYLYYDGVMYMVTEFKRDYQENIIQIKAQETTEKRSPLQPPPTGGGLESPDQAPSDLPQLGEEAPSDLPQLGEA